ncbi:MAG: tRNA (adenosine(37)-N6)-dimethylallyltransferase MiaA [Thermoplasmatota archaeon]
MILPILCGPTASGKTRIAEKIARELDADIISADSRTVYRGLVWGNGRYSLSKDITYHMVDIIEIGAPYSSHDFVIDSRKEIDRIFMSGRRSIICGGTMHFIDRFVRGFDSLIRPDEEIRKHYRALAEEMGREYVHDILKDINPALAGGVHPSNLNRTLRYLEIARSPGEGHSIEPYQGDQMTFFIVWPMHILKRRIEARTDEMISIGWIEEVRDLVERGFMGFEPGLDSIGYREIMDHLNGGSSLDEARRKIVSQTVKFARRQLNWLKRMDSNVVHIESEDQLDGAPSRIMEIMRDSDHRPGQASPRTASL